MKAKDAGGAPEPVLIESLALDTALRNDAADEAAARKLETAVECLRFVERWARREQWDLRRRVIKALQDMGEWTA